MQKTVICAAVQSSGVRHRLGMLSYVKHFADTHKYKVCMLWGVTSGVSYCRFEELFSPIPGVTVSNIDPHQLEEIRDRALLNKPVKIGTNHYEVFQAGKPPNGNIFCWDLSHSCSLAHCVAGQRKLIAVSPVAHLRDQTASFVRRNQVGRRLGIRVRVEENIHRDRKPHRVSSELNSVIRSIARIPWYVRVFIATDSEYIQQMVASHFADAVYLPKEFDRQEQSGRYVHRQDKNAMFTFLKEVECLCNCEKIINIGGFLNDHTIQEKMIKEPYVEVTPMYLRSR